MTRKQRKQEARSRERVVTVGDGINPAFRIASYNKALQLRPLSFIQRQIKSLYRDAWDANRKLAAYALKNDNAMPLLTSDHAAEVLAIGEKFQSIGMELGRRGVRPVGDAPLGGPYFREFFKQLRDVNDRQQTEQAGSEKLVGKIKSWIKRLF